MKPALRTLAAPAEAPPGDMPGLSRRMVLGAVAGFALAPASDALGQTAARARRVPISSVAAAAIQRQRGRVEVALQEQGLRLGSPILIRAVKSERSVEFFVRGEDGRFQSARRMRMCGSAPEQGPRTRQTPRRVPEGFYSIGPDDLSPGDVAQFATRLDWPNRRDTANRDVTGDRLLLQGRCAEGASLSLTDQDMEVALTLIYAALALGQPRVPVQIFPFPMGGLSLLRRGNDPAIGFWREIQPGWTAFERTRQPPRVRVPGRSYVIEPVG